MQTINTYSTTTAAYLLTNVAGYDMADSGTASNAADIVNALLDSHNADSKLKSVWADYLKSEYDFFSAVTTAAYHNAGMLEDADLGKRLQSRMRTRLADACELVGIARRKFGKNGLEIAASRDTSKKVAKYTKAMTTTAKNIGKYSKRDRVRLAANLLEEAGLTAADVEAIAKAMQQIEGK